MFFSFLNAERRKINEYQWEVNVDSPQQRDIQTLVRLRPLSLLFLPDPDFEIFIAMHFSITHKYNK